MAKQRKRVQVIGSEDPTPRVPAAVLVRMDSELSRALASAAAADKRTPPAYIRQVLRQHLGLEP